MKTLKNILESLVKGNATGKEQKRYTVYKHNGLEYYYVCINNIKDFDILIQQENFTNCNIRQKNSADKMSSYQQISDYINPNCKNYDSNKLLMIRPKSSYNKTSTTLEYNTVFNHILTQKYTKICTISAQDFNANYWEKHFTDE